MDIEPASEVTVYPALTDRIKSTIADGIFILILLSVFSVVLDQYTEVPDWLRMFLFLFIFFMYEPIAQTSGCSLGNYIMGIRVRKSADPTQNINIFQAYLRFIVKSLLGWISFFTIHSNPKRQAIHDMAAKTVVVYVL